MEWLIWNGAAVCCHLIWSLFHKSWASFTVKLYIDLGRRSDTERIMFLFFLMSSATQHEPSAAQNSKSSLYIYRYILHNIYSHFPYVYCLLCSCLTVLMALQIITAVYGWVSTVTVSLFPAALWPPHWALSKSKPLLSRQALTSWPLPVRCSICLR